MQDCLLAPSASGGLMDIPQVHASAKACGQGTWVGNMVAPTFIPADPSAPRAPHVPPAPWSCSPDSFALPATSSSSSSCCCCCCCCCFYFCCVFCCCCKVILVMVRVCFLSGWISEVVCWVTPLWPAEGSTARQAWIRSRDVQRCPEMSRNGHISRDMASLMDMKGALLHGVLSTWAGWLAATWRFPTEYSTALALGRVESSSLDSFPKILSSDHVGR